MWTHWQIQCFSFRVLRQTSICRQEMLRGQTSQTQFFLMDDRRLRFTRPWKESRSTRQEGLHFFGVTDRREEVDVVCYFCCIAWDHSDLVREKIIHSSGNLATLFLINWRKFKTTWNLQLRVMQDLFTKFLFLFYMFLNGHFRTYIC